jgi:hypothetical protein
VEQGSSEKIEIPISFDADGCPELPTTTVADGYQAKVVQSMLRAYCHAHIREPPLYPFAAMYNTYELGFLTGNQNLVIPWGTLEKNPNSWISEECTPDEFEWRDPSHIKVGQIFRLLNHWRRRLDQGLDHLIWLPTCPMFQDVEQPPRRERHIRKATEERPPMSDEENFDLPASGDIDEEEHQDDSEDSSDDSTSPGNSSENGDSIDLNMDSPHIHTSFQERNTSGELYDLLPDISRHLICTIFLDI